jgi:hypothetical protein
MSAVTIDTVLVRDSEPVAANIDQEVVMLSVRAGAYFGLNEVGGEIWNMLAEPRRIEEICHALSQRYDVEHERMTREVIQFLEVLVEQRLVRVVDGSGG